MLLVAQVMGEGSKLKPLHIVTDRESVRKANSCIAPDGMLLIVDC